MTRFLVAILAVAAALRPAIAAPFAQGAGEPASSVAPPEHSRGPHPSGFPRPSGGPHHSRPPHPSGPHPSGPHPTGPHSRPPHPSGPHSPPPLPTSSEAAAHPKRDTSSEAAEPTHPGHRWPSGGPSHSRPPPLPSHSAGEGHHSHSHSHSRPPKPTGTPASAVPPAKRDESLTGSVVLPTPPPGAPTGPLLPPPHSHASHSHGPRPSHPPHSEHPHHSSLTVKPPVPSATPAVAA